ncbi:response regulator transcription factor [Pontibacter akesuensis]|uniref:Phosphate regulon transcriptional regulatory protein PhoB n=1 Tax=Pontibacter akesuensis TaxID=388950 RepID=A0A1I7JFX7_9BACT|nr:response regulator transcription factor [Pontibacter akesuensis]GHA70246.1 DNA-binding response regulator [Pontibacter akesuensis]SFU84061.1 two-component system, OmpR family, alkaline phosphatase synthesis response regulator PhoP [Pontibacter akesuensis]
MQTTSHYKILVVDDDPDIVELLHYNLVREGYDVTTADNGKKAIDVAVQSKPDVILMDVMMPVMDGIAACRQLREMSEFRTTHIIFLTARSEEFSEVAAFEAGADDFINKPIKPRALLSRLAAFTRRDAQEEEKEQVIEVGDLRIDRTSFAVYKGEAKITLPKKEFELLSFLATTPNKVYTREELLNNVWGSDVYVIARTVDVHIRKVREKIGEDNIKTIKGVGYKFNTD